MALKPLLSWKLHTWKCLPRPNEVNIWTKCVDSFYKYSTLSKQGDGFTVSYCSTSTTPERWKQVVVGVFFYRIEKPTNTFICVLKACHMSRVTFCGVSHFLLFHLLIFLQFPSHLHYCTFSFLFSISMLPAFLPPQPLFFWTLLFFYYSHPSPFLPPLPHLCLFNSVTVSHMSNPDTFFSLWPCCRTLADSATQLHNARGELSRQASKCINASLKKDDCISVNKATWQWLFFWKHSQML